MPSEFSYRLAKQADVAAVTEAQDKNHPRKDLQRYEGTTT